MADRSAVFREGVAAYQAGRHYEAHEHWEELWQDESDPDRSRFLQALIQIASAVHKARNDVGPRGAVRLLDAAREKLEGLPEAFLGVDLAALRRGMTGCRAEVERQLTRGGPCRIDDAHVPPLRELGASALWHDVRPAPAVPLGARGTFFDQGLLAYERGDFFDAHELWEQLWRDEPQGPARTFLQGLIQLAAAMHKAVASRAPAPAHRLLGRAIEKLRAVPDPLGLDLTQLLAEAARAREVLATAAPGSQLDAALVPRIARGSR
jgi:predicted metal-dependent hydrolase